MASANDTRSKGFALRKTGADDPGRQLPFLIFHFQFLTEKLRFPDFLLYGFAYREQQADRGGHQGQAGFLAGILLRVNPDAFLGGGLAAGVGGQVGGGQQHVGIGAELVVDFLQGRFQEGVPKLSIADFSFEGFVFFTIEDITETQTIQQLQAVFTRLQSDTEPAIYRQFETALRNLCGQPDLQISVVPIPKVNGRFVTLSGQQGP